MLAPALELTDGLVVIDDRPIVRHANLTVGAGEFVALMGANGSGKSTLVRAFVGLLPLAGGTLRMFGVDQGRFADWGRVGYVPQRASAEGGVPASVEEVVATGRLAGRWPFAPARAEDRAAIRDAIATVGLAGRAKDRVSTLSGGQQQRVLIARALAGQCDLFFMDEPTAGVDWESQKALHDALAHLKRAGATVVLVAHELGPLADLVDRMIVLADGLVVHDGPVVADHGHAPHHSTDTHPDHLPYVASPLDARPGGTA